MAVMKQIENCLKRAFSNKDPFPRSKWKGFWIDHPQFNHKLMYLYHYHHLILAYDPATKRILYEWWEKPADKRGLDSAKEWLKQNGKLRE